MGKNDEYYKLVITNKLKPTRIGTNRIPFRIGETISVYGMPGVPVNGTYKIMDIGSQVNGSDSLILECFTPGGGCFKGWAASASYNIPIFKGRVIRSSGGAEVSDESPAFGNSDLWVHFLAGRLTGKPLSPAIIPTPTPPPPLPPPILVETPSVIISEPPLTQGNNLTGTGDGTSGFDIDAFIVRANFKAGLSAAANAKGAAAFRADAKRAAKQAKLTPAQTQKLMDAVNKAIAEAIAKAKTRPLPKPRARRR